MPETLDSYPPVVRLRAEITDCREVARFTLLIGLKAPGLCKQATPGQFVMLGPLKEDAWDPFLNRPFSIHRCTSDGRLELLVAVVGRGTGMLRSLQPGDGLWILGPLGSGFSVPDECGRVILVGGGLGVAPLYFLAERSAAGDREVSLLYGAATRADLAPTRCLESAGVQTKMATDDGSYLPQGTAVDLLRAELGGLSADELETAYLAACGPEGMLKAAWELTQSMNIDAPFEVSLENRMACGLGACMGCTVFLADGVGRRVCCQGPVFRAGEVFGQ